MKKIHRTVMKETWYIAFCVLLFSALMQAVFLLIGKWNYTVLLGNVLSGITSITNFFLMGLTIQSITHEDAQKAKSTMRLSQCLRLFMLFAFTALGVLLPVFDTVAVLITLFFPRLAIALRPLVGKLNKGN